MPLGSWFSFHWYPDQMAAVGQAIPTASLSINSLNRMNSVDVSVPSSDVTARVTKTMSLQDTTQPSGSLSMKSLNSMSLTNKIGELTADDVTGAVLTAQIAPGLTLKDALLDARKNAKLAAALSA